MTTIPRRIFRCSTCSAHEEIANPIGHDGREGNCTWCGAGVLLPLERVGQDQAAERERLEAALKDANASAESAQEDATEWEKEAGRLEKQVEQISYERESARINGEQLEKLLAAALEEKTWAVTLRVIAQDRLRALEFIYR